MRARSAATASADASRPAASGATASARAGSGVTDSQEARLTMGSQYKLITKSGKKRMDTTAPTPTASSTPSGIALEPRLYTDPAVLEAEQELIFERTWQLMGHIS